MLKNMDFISKCIKVLKRSDICDICMNEWTSSVYTYTAKLGNVDLGYSDTSAITSNIERC